MSELDDARCDGVERGGGGLKAEVVAASITMRRSWACRTCRNFMLQQEFAIALSVISIVEFVVVSCTL